MINLKNRNLFNCSGMRYILTSASKFVKSMLHRFTQAKSVLACSGICKSAELTSRFTVITFLDSKFKLHFGFVGVCCLCWRISLRNKEFKTKRLFGAWEGGGNGVCLGTQEIPDPGVSVKVKGSLQAKLGKSGKHIPTSQYISSFESISTFSSILSLVASSKDLVSVFCLKEAETVCYDKGPATKAERVLSCYVREWDCIEKTSLGLFGH